MNSSMIGSHCLLMIDTHEYRRDWIREKKYSFYRSLLHLLEYSPKERLLTHLRSRAYPVYDDRHRRM